MYFGRKKLKKKYFVFRVGKKCALHGISHLVFRLHVSQHLDELEDYGDNHSLSGRSHLRDLSNIIDGLRTIAGRCKRCQINVINL